MAITILRLASNVQCIRPLLRQYQWLIIIALTLSSPAVTGDAFPYEGHAYALYQWK